MSALSRALRVVLVGTRCTLMPCYRPQRLRVLWVLRGRGARVEEDGVVGGEEARLIGAAEAHLPYSRGTQGYSCVLAGYSLGTHSVLAGYSQGADGYA